MHRTFESWADDFSFSEDLKELERNLTLSFADDQSTAQSKLRRSARKTDKLKVYQNTGVIPSFQQEIQPEDVMSPTELPESEFDSDRDMNFETFTSILAQVLSDKMTERAFMEKLAKFQDLKRDNEIMANQIHQLKRENKQLEMQLQKTERINRSFKRIAGNLYLRFE
jgi:hypothetical protein